MSRARVGVFVDDDEASSATRKLENSLGRDDARGLFLVFGKRRIRVRFQCDIYVGGLRSKGSTARRLVRASEQRRSRRAGRVWFVPTSCSTPESRRAGGVHPSRRAGQSESRGDPRDRRLYDTRGAVGSHRRARHVLASLRARGVAVRVSGWGGRDRGNVRERDPSSFRCW